MKALVTFKTGGDSGHTKSRVCDFQEKELNQLISDWQFYVTNTNAKQGGVYKCQRDNVEHVLFLRFDDVLFIE
jgi:hypothetical protein